MLLNSSLTTALSLRLNTGQNDLNICAGEFAMKYFFSVVVVFIVVFLVLWSVHVEREQTKANINALMARPCMQIVVDSNGGIDSCYQFVGWKSDTDPRFNLDEKRTAFMRLNNLCSPLLQVNQLVKVPLPSNRLLAKAKK